MVMTQISPVLTRCGAATSSVRAQEAGTEGRRLHSSGDVARRSRTFRGVGEGKKEREKKRGAVRVVPVADSGGGPSQAVHVGAAGAGARRRLDHAVQRPGHAAHAGAQRAHQARHAVELRQWRRRLAGRALGEGGRRGEGGGGAAATVAAARRTVLERRGEEGAGGAAGVGGGWGLLVTSRRHFDISTEFVGCARRRAADPPPELQRATTSRRLLWHLQRQQKSFFFVLKFFEI